jgi:hypothetical protein
MIPSAGAGALVTLLEALSMGHGAAHIGYKSGKRSRLRSRNNRIEPVELVFHIYLTRCVSAACVG